jgi:hypothetical protein
MNRALLSSIDCNIEESHAKLYGISLNRLLVSLSSTAVSPRFSTFLWDQSANCALFCAGTSSYYAWPE